MPKPMLRSTPLAAQLTRSSLAFAATPQQTATPESAAARGQVQRQADLRTGIYDVLISEQRTRLALLIRPAAPAGDAAEAHHRAGRIEPDRVPES